ncbi:MAG: ArsR/SmtB family transcription factor [Christensenellales bacterium]
MLYIRSLREGLPVFKALGSATRVAVMELLLEKGPMRMTAIAEHLGITGGALTSHVKELTDAGLIYIETTGGKHGLQKICHAYNQHMLVEAAPAGYLKMHQQDVPVGSFVDSRVSEPCGLALSKGPIPGTQEANTFQAPEREHAELVWLAEGDLTYALPTPLVKGDKALELNISLEMAAFSSVDGRQGATNVSLAINDTNVATWVVTSGRMGDRSSYSWWQRNWPQHGIVHLISIGTEGTFVNDKRVSAAKIGNLVTDPGDIRLTISAQPAGRRTGGLMIFGSAIGHFTQNIHTLLKYRRGKQR